MIPLYPPRQGDPSLRLVKWRSLVQLVHHSHDSDEAPRARSHSTIVFLPNSRKHSSTSQYNVRKKSESAVTDKRPSSLERQRRPSAPSLGDLKRFLPNLIHRSRSSANIEEDGVELLAGGSGSGVESVPEHQAASSSHSTSSPHLQSHQQQRPDSASGAKNKVQRLKAAATNPPSLAKETVAAQQQQQSNSRPNFFFKKQGRKPIVVEQSTLVVSGSTTVVHGPLALTTNRPLIDSGNAQKPSALDQNTVIKKVSVVESAEEDPVVVVVDPSLLLANKSAAKELKKQHPIASLPESSQASSQTVPKVSRKKPTSIQLLTSVFHRRKHSAQHPTPIVKTLNRQETAEN